MVKYRVIEQLVIERRYIRRLKNFFSFYKALADKWAIYDNSHEIDLIAKGTSTLATTFYNEDIWRKILSTNERSRT